MRMRRKKHGAERIAACSSLLIQDPALLTTVLPDGTPLFRTPGISSWRSAVGRAILP